jgi:hypothetical protein
MKMRRIVSLTMFLSFAVMVYTGLMLFLTPHGRVAYWNSWRLGGLSKDQYAQLHTTFMIVFIVAGVWHLTQNWGAIKTYLKTRARKWRIFTPELNVALVLIVLFAVGTLTLLPPWSTLLSWQGSIKDYWERRDGSPPWGHAEENTLSRFTRGLVDWERLDGGREVSLPVEEALAALRAEGLAVRDEKQRLVDIATANDTTPGRLMEILRQAATPVGPSESPVETAETAGGPFPTPYSGLGRMSLAQYCDKYGLGLEELRAHLPEGVAADPESTFRELAEELETDPKGVIDLLNERTRTE